MPTHKSDKWIYFPFRSKNFWPTHPQTPASSPSSVLCRENINIQIKSVNKASVIQITTLSATVFMGWVMGFFFCCCCPKKPTWMQESERERGGNRFQRRVQKPELTEGEEWVMSLWHIQEGRGRREGERKRKLYDKFLCILLQSYANFHRVRVWMEAWRTPTCWRDGPAGRDGPRFGCGCAQLMTTSNINWAQGLGPRVTTESKSKLLFLLLKNDCGRLLLIVTRPWHC